MAQHPFSSHSHEDLSLLKTIGRHECEDLLGATTRKNSVFRTLALSLPLARNGVGITDTDEQQIIEAARTGHLSTLAKFKQQGAVFGNVVDDRKASLLHIAALESQPDVLKLLLGESDVRRCIDAPDLAQRTPLHVAAALGHSVVVQLLLDSRASHRAVDRAEWTPLHWATHGEHAHVCELLLTSKADALRPDAVGESASNLLVMSKDKELTACFQRFGFPPPRAAARVSTAPLGSLGQRVVEEADANWVAFQGRGSQAYYWNRRAGDTTWEKPEDVEVAWYAFRSNNGAFYYWCALTDETVWELPPLDDAEGQPRLDVEHTTALASSAPGARRNTPSEVSGDGEVPNQRFAPPKLVSTGTGVLSDGSPVSPGDECDLIVREELMYQEARRLENEIEVALAARDAVELSSLLEVARHSLDASRIATLRVELDTLFSVTTDDKPVQ